MSKRVKSEEGAWVDWLERDKHIIEGLDQLGIWSVSINLYGLLLPGITNVTERARYYAFYPWVLHNFAQSNIAGSGRVEWLHWFRSFDFGYAMACVAHEMSESNSYSATAVVGADAARRLLRGSSGNEVIDIKSSALLDEADKVPKSGAYFKNPEGGFGQYYKNPLRDMGIIRKDPNHRYPDSQLTTYAGVPIAKSLDSQSAFHRLAELVSIGHARFSELAKLGSLLSPSAIERRSQEEILLRRLFLGEDDNLCSGQHAPVRAWRRASLLLALQYIRDSELIEKDAFANEFRWACATCALPNGKPWKLQPAQKPVAAAWGAYHRNDLLNYALESLFWVVLRMIDQGSLTPRSVARQLAGMGMRSIKASKNQPGRHALSGHVSDWLNSCQRPESEAEADPWGPGSTCSWAGLLEAAVRNRDDQAVAGWAIRVLGRLASDCGAFRAHPFEHMPGAVQMAAAHEVHLGRWLDRVAKHTSESLKSFIEDLTLEWIIYRHLRVATRKLSSQGVSTFKFRPEHGTLLLITDIIPDPTFTGPRLRQAHRILSDLHYLTIGTEGTRISPDGAELLESCL